MSQHQPSNAIVAVCTLDYLASAGAFFESVQSQIPDFARYLLAADIDDRNADAWLRFASATSVLLVDPRHYLSGADLQSLTLRYSRSELCFALKPVVLRAALVAGAKTAIYCDTDTRLYADLSPLIDLLHNASIVLVPHITTPLPEDDHLPQDITILRAGAYNGGVIGVSDCSETYAFLDWWQQRVFRLGSSQQLLGYGGDQRWLDIVPSLFADARICRDVGINVAYWNLHERRLDSNDGQFTVNGKPLRLFHFSGYDPQKPQVLSRFQNRHRLTEGAALRELHAAYAAAHRTASHHFADLLPRVEVSQTHQGIPKHRLPSEAYRIRMRATKTEYFVEVGEAVVVDVEVTLPSSAETIALNWNRTDGGVALAYHLFNDAGSVEMFDGPRTAQQTVLLPGQPTMLRTVVQGLPRPGVFTVEVDMVHEGVQWFNDGGGETARVTLYASVFGPHWSPL